MDADAWDPRFSLDVKGHRVVWGERVFSSLAQELKDTGLERCLLITSPRLAERFEAQADNPLRQRVVGRFVDVVPHVPQASALQAIDAARRCAAGALLVFGGGSALDTAKAVSDELGLPIAAIPTTFSGSEVTWNFGLTVDGIKQTVRNPGVLPKIVFYDPTLVASLPVPLAICSGINAVAHAVEALYAPQSNAFTEALAIMGIRKMIGGLKSFAAASGRSTDAAAQCLTGAWLSGEVLSQVGMGLHHRICHVLGGTFGLPHAQAHTVMLPYVIEWNMRSAPVLQGLSDLFEGTALPLGLARFSVRHGAPASLDALGLTAAQIAEVARLALATPVPNPRPVTVDGVEAILTRAHQGVLVRGSA